MDLANSGDGGAAGAGGDGGQGGGATAAEIFGGGAAGGDAGQGGQGGGAAGEGGQGGEGGGEGGGGVDPNWYDQVSADPLGEDRPSLRDWLKASGVKDINQLATIARDNQVALRESGRIKVPGEGASETEVKAFHKAIGVPDDAKGYTVEPPKDVDGNAIELNTPLLERLAGVAHKAGVPKAAYEALVQDFVASQMEELATINAGEQAEAQAKLKEWGSQGNAKMSAIDNAMRALGLSREEGLKMRGALGAGRAMDLLSRLGEGLAEDVMLNGRGNNRFGISASQAQEQLNGMIKDKETAEKIRVPGTPERERYLRLQQIVGQEVDRKAAAGE